MSLKTGCARTSIESSLLPILSLTLTRSSPLMRSSISSENLKKMGHESYLLAKKRYEINKVNQSIFEIMEL